MSITESIAGQERSFARFRRPPSRPRDAAVLTDSGRGGLWSHVMAGLFVLTAGLFTTGIAHVRSNLYQAWADGLSAFRWLVFVEGEQVQMDEVGRYLRQLDAVDSVTFVSSEELLSAFQRSSLVPAALEPLSSQFVPSSWEVQWARDPHLQSGDLYGLANELNALPGVTDIAFDLRAWQNVQEEKERWLVFRLTLAACLLALVLALSVCLGRLLFFSSLRRLPGTSVTGTVLNALIWWSGGFGLAWLLLGPQPWPLLVGGLCAGVLHVAARMRAVAADA